MEPRRRSREVFRQTLGYAIAAACLVWVFHGIHGEQLIEQMRTISWGWVAIAAAFDILSYVFQGLRWRLLLRPAADVPLLRATQAVYVGLLTNEIVPLRAGELVRAYLVSRWQGIAFLSVVPSIAVERLFDGFWLAVGIALTAMFVKLPANLLKAADVLGVVILAAAALFIYLVARKGRSRPALAADAPLDPSLVAGGAGGGPAPAPVAGGGDGVPAGSPLAGGAGGAPARGAVSEANEHARGATSDRTRVRSTFGGLADGIQRIGTSRYFYLSLLASSLIFICQIVAFWLVMRGYGLALSPWTGAAVFMIMYFGTALPNAPSNLGTYQFFTVLGLTLFGVDKTTATGFSVAVFVVLTATLWIVGLVALARTGMKLGDIRRDIAALIPRK